MGGGGGGGWVGGVGGGGGGWLSNGVCLCMQQLGSSGGMPPQKMF